jgi:hypothetical protein
VNIIGRHSLVERLVAGERARPAKAVTGFDKSLSPPSTFGSQAGSCFVRQPRGRRSRGARTDVSGAQGIGVSSPRDESAAFAIGTIGRNTIVRKTAKKGNNDVLFGKRCCAFSTGGTRPCLGVAGVPERSHDPGAGGPTVSPERWSISLPLIPGVGPGHPSDRSGRRRRDDRPEIEGN